MEHVGIDLGSRQSSICIVDEKGKERHKANLKTAELAAFFEQLEASRIAIESCAESRVVALMAIDAGHDVRIVPTKFVRSLEIGARRIKTDARDARALAMASFRLGDELPHIHIRSDESNVLHDLVHARASLLKARTASINFVRGHLRKNLLGHVSSRSRTFEASVRRLLNDKVPIEVSTHLALIASINEQVAVLDKEMSKHAESETAKRLQAITGVGPIVALSFIAAVDDPDRFKSGSHLASYVGLSPGENTTGGRIKRTGIIAAGQSMLRALLVQAAHSMMNARRSREPMADWAAALQTRSNRKRAACALARRLAVVMWAMLRDGARYDPSMTRPRHPRPLQPTAAAELTKAMRRPAA